ncbi:peptidoglycan-binding domain-containing protein [Marinobacter sp. DS40M6]|uniref:peptidoglycan-binding domain-containing protein n=1 Tax=Marinobacter sp. DS40M6 TaxID=1597776 RepID=UPI00235A3D98|nr:peptidoglycan-binding protein [Marinobacter sp. DS40M6]MDC8455409.1 peptidoglycan-binding protein [Marinobacter sp. DS40M6]
MSHSRFTRMPGFLAALTVSFCAVAQADPADTIFAAENALYGAGYDIGKADGWMDDTLRSAIRKYQSGREGLQATGDLDPQTLSALGIAVKDGDAVTGNSARSREGAMADAGISKQRFGSPSAKQPIAAAPEPEVKPEPVPVSTEAPTLEEESAPAPETIVATNDKPVIQPETELAQDSKPKPQIAEEPETEPVAVAAVEEPSIVEETSTVEELSTVDAEPSVALNVPSEATEETSTDVDYQLPEEPTASGNPEISESLQATSSTSDNTSESTTVAKSSGGFFSSLFDFLFGWLI